MLSIANTLISALTQCAVAETVHDADKNVSRWLENLEASFICT